MQSWLIFDSILAFNNFTNFLIEWIDFRIVIRIRCDPVTANTNSYYFGEKFGCDHSSDAVHLIKATLNLGLTLHGFSFHTGSPCWEAKALCRGIDRCKNLINTAKAMGCQDVQLIDIGGGFVSEPDAFDEV